MTIRIGVNGVGRIGRNLWRIVNAAQDVALVAANDTADQGTLAYLLRHDTARGAFPGTVHTDGDTIVVDGVAVPVSHEPTPDRIDWHRYGVDIVVEATGQFTRARDASGHLRGGASTVIISTASPDADVTLMMGVNEQVYDPTRHRVVSNSCCTTYCIAAMTSVLHPAYDIRAASVTAAYSYGSRPGPLLDEAFPNLRMARANATNIVPANVPGVRRALDRVQPGLAGRIAVTALRVPVPVASTASMVARLSRRADATEVNAALQAAAASALKGYLEVSHDPLVSSDIIGRTVSCVVDAGLTTSLGDLVRVVGWYDNEWGYAHRLLDLVRFLARRCR